MGYVAETAALCQLAAVNHIKECPKPVHKMICTEICLFVSTPVSNHIVDGLLLPIKVQGGKSGRGKTNQESHSPFIQPIKKPQYEQKPLIADNHLMNKDSNL